MKIKLGAGPMKMSDIGRLCRCDIYNLQGGGDIEFSYVCTDSREADADTLFVATRGERVDGHDYIVDALDRGCRCVICEYYPSMVKGRPIVLAISENSMDAFSAVARSYREIYARGVEFTSVAVTGSVGKTTTKEMLRSVLEPHRSLYCTKGNFNSIIGMPMSLMEVSSDRDTGIFEMGMSARGEIDLMSRTLCPSIAIITNIGSSHLEYLGTRENIAAAKFEIVNGMGQGGVLMIDGDEPLLCELADTVRDRLRVIRVCQYGDTCDCRISNIRADGDGTLFDLFYNGETLCDIRISIAGRHLVETAAYAYITGRLLGLSDEECRQGILSFSGVAMRQTVERKGNATVICDYYNASPESAVSALDLLCDMKTSGKRIALLGDMLELGERSAELHFSTGQYASSRADVIICVGERAYDIARGAQAAGLEFEKDLYYIKENIPSDIAELLQGIICEGDLLLMKASRGMHFENIFGELRL